MQSHAPSHVSALRCGRVGFRWGASTFAVVALVIGCSRSSGPNVQFVEGHVLLDGEPLAGADVGFNPESNSGIAASGQTDAAGVFTLTSARGGVGGRGAVAGTYVVTVCKFGNLVEALGAMPDPETDPDGAAKWRAEAARLNSLPPEFLTPKRYGDKATSPLRVEIKKGRNVGPELTFELSDDSKQPKP